MSTLMKYIIIAAAAFLLYILFQKEGFVNNHIFANSKLMKSWFHPIFWLQYRMNSQILHIFVQLSMVIGQNFSQHD